MTGDGRPLRLNKYLARCGLGSRRKVETLIAARRIAVNGVSAITPAIQVKTGDRVTLDGILLALPDRFLYLIMYKPAGFVTTTNDEKGRATVMDLLPERFVRAGLFPVGRLDQNTEGLLLFTNDGELAQRITRPSFHVQKEYTVFLNRPLEAADRAIIEKGFFIPQLGIKTRPAKVSVTDRMGTHVRIIIDEGKNRQIRYTLGNLDYKIKKLTRISVGTLKLAGVPYGGHLLLAPQQVKRLRRTAGLD